MWAKKYIEYDPKWKIRYLWFSRLEFYLSAGDYKIPIQDVYIQARYDQSNIQTSFWARKPNKKTSNKRVTLEIAMNNNKNESEIIEKKMHKTITNWKRTCEAKMHENVGAVDQKRR